MSFTPRTSRFNVVAFRRVAVILALLTAGFGLAHAAVPVAVVSSGNLLSPTGYVDTTDARSLPNEFPGLVDLRGWGVRLDSSRSPLSSPARAIPNAPPAGQNVSALSPNDASITFACCAYNPTVVTITVGASVSWSGNFSFPHPLQQVAGPTSDVLVPGGFGNSTGTFYSVPFNAPGTFYYRCGIHGVAQFGGTMRGQIVVLGPPVFLYLPLVIK